MLVGVLPNADGVGVLPAWFRWRNPWLAFQLEMRPFQMKRRQDLVSLRSHAKADVGLFQPSPHGETCAGKIDLSSMSVLTISLRGPNLQRRRWQADC